MWKLSIFIPSFASRLPNVRLREALGTSTDEKAEGLRSDTVFVGLNRLHNCGLRGMEAVQ